MLSTAQLMTWEWGCDAARRGCASSCTRLHSALHPYPSSIPAPPLHHFGDHPAHRKAAAFPSVGSHKSLRSPSHPKTPPDPCSPSPAYAIFLLASARHRVLSWLTQATRLPLAEKQMLCTHPQLLLDSNISSPNGILEPQGVGLGRSSTSLM